MKRRDFITLIGGAAAAWPLAARAQQVPVIGVLYSGNSEALQEDFAAFRDGLAETGLVEGRNVAFEFRMAESHLDRLPALADDLVRRRVRPSGSPFLEGATVTVAGAALLQRVTAAVTKLGGNVQSSQVDLQGTQSKTGFLTIIASCDIDQPGLQQLLYDVEAGMPFLFVDQLVVQAPASFAASSDGKLR